MSVANTPVIIRNRRSTAAEWSVVNPVLHDGQLGYETDTGKWKWGDGLSEWSDLPYAQFEISPETLYYQFACSDLETPLAAKDPAGFMPAPRDFTITGAVAYVLTASDDGDIEIDIKKNGVSIFSTILTIDESGIDSDGSVSPFALDAGEVDVVAGDRITAEIVAPGDNATGLVVTLIGVPA
jgi:hypothetical protein